MIKIRAKNRSKIINSVRKSEKWSNQIDFLNPTKKVTPSWFGLPFLINQKFIGKKDKFMKYLM